MKESKSENKPRFSAITSKGTVISRDLKMAEPLHRVVPKGVTSGASIRGFELSPLQMVKEICLFYVKKCSGKYEDNKAAARYVHSMAEEIITQLSGVATELKRSKGEPELYQALLDEWNENFPSSLGAMGSPKNISSLIANQTKEINDLRAALDYQISKRENDVTEILRSMDAQLQAYKVSVMSERRQQQLIEKQRSEDFELRIKAIENQYRKEIDEIMSEQVKQIKNNNKTYELRHIEATEVINYLQKCIEENAKNHLSEIDRVKISKNKKYMKLQDKYDRLKNAYQDLSNLLNDDDSNATLPSILKEDDETIGGLTEDYEDDHEDEEVIEFDADRDLKANKKNRKEKINKENEIKLTNKIEIQKESSKKVDEIVRNTRNNSFANKGDTDSTTVRSQQTEQNIGLYKQFKLQIEQLNDTNKKLNEQILSLKQQLNNLIAENNLYNKRVQESEKLNESLRKVLSVKIIEGNRILPESLHTIQPIAKVLCHTPHFLHTDKNGLTSNNKLNISSYQTIGRF